MNLIKQYTPEMSLLVAIAVTMIIVAVQHGY
jgi:hypothetical protein